MRCCRVRCEGACRCLDPMLCLRDDPGYVAMEGQQAEEEGGEGEEGVLGAFIGGADSGSVAEV